MIKIKKLTVIFLALMMLVLSACGGDKYENREDTLYIVSINKGYGVQWLKDIAELYEEKTDMKVDISIVYDDNIIINRLESGPEFCNYDLIFSGDLKTNNFLADLTDVYETTLEGKTKTIKESIDKTLLDCFREKDKGGNDVYYTMPWTQGVNGLLVNYEAASELFGANWQQQYPLRTTNELLAFAQAIKSEGKNAFGHCADTNYYMFLYDTWWAQYEGLDNIADFFEGKYTDFAGEEKIGPEVFLQQGRLESMEVMEAIFAPPPKGGGYSDPRSNGITWEVTQTYFMLGQFIMFSNGDWNNLEMSKSFPNTDIRFVKVPVISSLADKLGITENDLRNIIDYIDSDRTIAKPSFTSTNSDYNSDEIIEHIAESRALTNTFADAHVMAIPSYSKKIVQAKDFIKLMISDEGQKLYTLATNGLTLGYGYDLESADYYNSLSAFAKSRWQIAKNAKYFLFSKATFEGLKIGNSTFRAHDLAPLEVLISRDVNRMTAQQIFEYDYTYWNGQNWLNLLATSQGGK